MSNSKNILNEDWKDILGYEDSYQVSSLGRIRSKDRWSYRNGKKYQRLKGRILKLWKDTRGYPQIYLCKNGKQKPASVHRLVAFTFIYTDKDTSSLTVNHKNGVLDDNRVNNLEWCTQKENNQHAWDNGLMNPRRGETHPCAKLNIEKAREIRRLRAEENISYRKLGLRFKVSSATIQQIVSNKTWKE